MSLVPFTAPGQQPTAAPVQSVLSAACESALAKLVGLLPEGMPDNDLDRVCDLLAHSACPGAEYLLITRGERVGLLLLGDSAAEQMLVHFVGEDAEDANLLHVRLRPAGVTVSGVDLHRAQALVAIQWGFDLHTVRHRAAMPRPMHVVRRSGHAVGTCVLHQDGQALRGQIWVQPGLTRLDQVRTWFSLVEAASAELGRRPTVGDDVLVNNTPFLKWLAAAAD